MRKKIFHAHARTCTRIYVDLYKTRLQGQNGYGPSVPYISTVLGDWLFQDVTKSVVAGGKKAERDIVGSRDFEETGGRSLMKSKESIMSSR